MTDKMVSILARAQERTKFLIICRYLNLLKKQSKILQQRENTQVVTTLKLCTDYGGKCM